MILVTVAIIMASTEPFFYDSAYKLVKKEYICVVNRYHLKMHHSKEWCILDEIPRYSAKKPPMKWEYSNEYKNLSDSDVYTIIDLDIDFAGGAGIF